MLARLADHSECNAPLGNSSLMNRDLRAMVDSLQSATG
jgi:hypothetical protein